MEHEQVYCVDANAELNFGKVMGFVQQNIPQDKLQELMTYGQQMTEQKTRQITTLNASSYYIKKTSQRTY